MVEDGQEMAPRSQRREYGKALRDQVRFSRASEEQRRIAQRDQRMLQMAQEAILKVFERGILYFPLGLLREKIQDADMNILIKALDILVKDGRVIHVRSDLYASPEWDGVIDHNPRAKSATVADLAAKKTAENIPQGGEQVSAPITPPPNPLPKHGEGEQNRADPNANILSVRIRRELAAIPGLHCTVLIPRLGCTRGEFLAAMRTLKTLGVVRETLLNNFYLVEGRER